MGWAELSNGDLLRVAEDAGFDVFLTTDKNLPYRQNLKGRKIAIVVVAKNRWSLVKTALPQIVSPVNEAAAGTHVMVDVPDA